MLGSGIEKAIQNAGELHVPAGQVHSSEAKTDALASWGRFQRQDPRRESFDAKVISSEDATIDGTYYQGTTEHNSLVHRKNGDGYGTWIRTPPPCMRRPSQQRVTETVSCQANGLYRLGLELRGIE